MGSRRRKIIRRAEVRHRARSDYLERTSAGHEAELSTWRSQVFEAARHLASQLPELAGHDADVIIEAGSRRWWRLFRRSQPIVGWHVASFKFWEPDPQGRAVPAYAPATVYIDLYGRWVGVIGRGEWLMIQGDPSHLAEAIPGDDVVSALAEGVPEIAKRYWIETPTIGPQPE